MFAFDKTMKIVAAGLMLGGFLMAQSSSSKPHAPGTKKNAPAKKSGTAAAKPSLAWKQECSKGGGFCVDVPRDWKSEGEVFDGAGFVVAEPSKVKEEVDWNQITAAATDMPEPENGHDRPTTDELIDIILGSPSGGIHAQTLQRSRLTVAGMPTEVIKVRLRSAESGTDAIEFIALMDDGETIYSVAVGCAPEDAPRMQPIFDHALHSWKATIPVPPATPQTSNPPR